MSGFALSGLAVAMQKLNSAIARIEAYCEEAADTERPSHLRVVR